MQTEHAVGNAAGPTSPTPNDIVHGYFAALNSSDTEGLTGLFADDGIMMADDYPSAVGKNTIRAMFEGAFAATKIQMDCQIDSVVERDELAVVRAHSTGTLTLLDSGATIEQEHRELYVLGRTDDRWRITQYMFNSPSAAAS